MDKLIKTAIADIVAQWGDEAITKATEEPNRSLHVISTGSINLDIALGVKGIPLGKIVEVFGPEASGKTTLGLHMVADANRQGYDAAYIDSEYAFNNEYAKKIGVDPEKLWLVKPRYGEEAFDIIEKLVGAEAVKLIIIDSVAALVPKSEFNTTFEGGGQGSPHARMMSHALRKLAGLLERKQCACIFINQLRNRIGQFGTEEITTGGSALNFYASIRLDMRRKDTTQNESGLTSALTEVKVVKNKVAASLQTAVIYIANNGIEDIYNVIDLAIKHEVFIDYCGAGWLVPDRTERAGNRRFKNRKTIKMFLLKHPNALLDVKKRVFQKVDATPTLVSNADTRSGDAQSPSCKTS